MCRSNRYINKMINWVLYNDDQKPTEGICDARWRAMVVHIKREYLVREKQND